MIFFFLLFSFFYFLFSFYIHLSCLVNDDILTFISKLLLLNNIKFFFIHVSTLIVRIDVSNVKNNYLICDK